MKKILIVVDMQNDFVSGSLGTEEAQAIVENVRKKILSYDREYVFATRDTHEKDYLQTQEGEWLPVEHCIKGTEGWQIIPEITQLIDSKNIIDKNTFGSKELVQAILEKFGGEDIEIELIGLCTDICVVSNALLLKAYMPEVKIFVDSSCCAGVSADSHQKALDTMKTCQIHVLPSN